MAEVMLPDLRQPGEFTGDLFAQTQPGRNGNAIRTMDAINARCGRGTVRSGIVPAEPGRGMRRELMSRNFTLHLDQLWSVN
ncbi:DUF4113 domain-containing protein [Pseudomonas sp. RC4D1]|nr:DUF4113 domain-containing protein [Pseudomonas sp. RC4D1]